MAEVTSMSDEKWRLFNCFFCRVGLRTYQEPCNDVQGTSEVNDGIAPVPMTNYFELVLLVGLY